MAAKGKGPKGGQKRQGQDGQGRRKGQRRHGSERRFGRQPAGERQKHRQAVKQVTLLRLLGQ
eukprot:6635295-Prorocentrum_lima.AAC.1